MKYKVLLTGNNKMVINEFFTYMDFSFECFSTSDRYDDIINHVKYIHPDALVYCLYGEHPDDLKRFVNVERKISREGIPIIIVGDADECDQFERVAPLMDVSIFRRPISSQKLEEAVISLLKEKRPEPARGRRSVTVTESTLKTEDVMRVAEELLAQLAKEEEKENPFVQGMEMVYKKLMTTLEGVGVKPIEAVGTEFNPDFHNAVMHVEDENFGENIVAEEFQKGYMYRDSVVRHSMVKVAN